MRNKGMVAIAAALGILVFMGWLITEAGAFALFLCSLLLPVAICVVLAAGVVWWLDTSRRRE